MLADQIEGLTQELEANQASLAHWQREAEAAEQAAEEVRIRSCPLWHQLYCPRRAPLTVLGKPYVRECVVRQSCTPLPVNPSPACAQAVLCVR